MDNSVVLCTVFYGIFIFFRRIYRTYIRVSVFLHFTEIYCPNEIQISLAYNFQKSPFFVVLLLKIAVFRNDFGEIRTISDCLWRIAVYQASCLWRIADFLGVFNDASLYLTHLIYHAYWIFVHYAHSILVIFVQNIQNMYAIFSEFWGEFWGDKMVR